MSRGRVPQVRVEVSNRQFLTADKEWANRQNKLAAIEAARKAGEVILYGRGVPSYEELTAPKQDYDQLSFRLALVNTGEVTIRDFVLSVAFTKSSELYQIHCPTTSGTKVRFRFAVRQENSSAERKIFPDDRIVFPDKDWFIHVPAGATVESHGVLMSWTVYLDDAPPSSGEIDMTDHFRDDSNR